MKKTEQTNLPELPHITRKNIALIANKASCHHSYVWMIVNGERSVKSAKAKRILAAAKVLNQSIESGLKKAGKKLELNQDQD